MACAPATAPIVRSFSESRALSEALGKAVAGLTQGKAACGAPAADKFNVAISGGSLPKLLANGLLAVEGIDYSKWHVFFADERVVPLDDADSNYKACDEAFFSKVGIPRKQIYTVDASLPSEAAAAAYTTQLEAVFGTGSVPKFDLVLLGMGPDGHTASLFPGHPVLEIVDHWVAHIEDSPKFPPKRVTLTYPVLNHANNVYFVCTGAGKARSLAIALGASEGSVPAGEVKPSANLVWFVDDAASMDYRERRMAKVQAELERITKDVAASVAKGVDASDNPITVPLSIVVFGATGNLAREKLYPSFRNLMFKGLIPYGSTIMAYGRSAMPMEEFCKKQLVNVKYDSAEEEAKFKDCLDYFQGSYADEEKFVQLDKALARREAPGANRLFVLSVPPTVFGDVCSLINKHVRAAAPGKTRVLVEKPFGRDLRTFEELNTLTSTAFDETELFRLDHYLAKQAIQNLVRQRITRGVFFDSIWSNEYVQSLHVSWKEDIDTQGRGGYFDQFGIIRDIMQNHLLQLFTFSAMEAGDGSDAAIAANKVEFLRSIKSLKMEDCVLGQFEGYLADETVPEGSRCPTYAAVALTVNNSRWKGVPMIITAGKGLSERTCTVEAALKPGLGYKSLLFRIQPDPGLWLLTTGESTEVPFMEALPDSTGVFNYERVLFDGARGSKMLMIGADELREAWRIFTPLLDHIDSEQPKPVLHEFQAVVPRGVADLARKVGITFNAIANSEVNATRPTAAQPYGVAGGGLEDSAASEGCCSCLTRLLQKVRDEPEESALGSNVIVENPMQATSS